MNPKKPEEGQVLGNRAHSWLAESLPRDAHSLEKEIAESHCLLKSGLHLFHLRHIRSFRPGSTLFFGVHDFFLSTNLSYEYSSIDYYVFSIAFNPVLILSAKFIK